MHILSFVDSKPVGDVRVCIWQHGDYEYEIEGMKDGKQAFSWKFHDTPLEEVYDSYNTITDLTKINHA